MTETMQSATPPADPGLMPAAPGQPPVDTGAPVQDDYFGYGLHSRERFMFPDGVTFIEYGKLNEGEKAFYELRTQGDFTIKKGTGDAKVAMDPGKQRHELITAAAKDWNLKTQGQVLPFTSFNLRKFLESTDPSIVENLHKAIQKINPWLIENATSADIRKEIAELEERLAETLERERGEASSSSK